VQVVRLDDALSFADRRLAIKIDVEHYELRVSHGNGAYAAPEPLFCSNSCIRDVRYGNLDDGRRRVESRGDFLAEFRIRVCERASVAYW